MPDAHRPAPAHVPWSYEPSDVGLREAAWLAAMLSAAVVLVPVLLRLLYPAALDVRAAGPREALPAMPRLQADPRADLATQRAAEERRLASYGWVDPAAERVRIPIGRAMDLMLTRGASGWAPARD